MKRQSENKIQSDAFIWFNNNYCLKHHNPRYMMYVQPNEIASLVGGVLKGLGVSSTIVTKAVSLVTASLKLVGFKAGVSDNVIIAPNRVFFIEFKTPLNNQQDNQKEFEERVTLLGHRYIVIKSLEAFKSFVLSEVIQTPTKE